MSESIKIVSAVLLQSEKVLLCLRKNTKDFPNHWAFPVGHLEVDENSVDALRRELFEELGIQMLDAEMLATLIDNRSNIHHQVFQVNDWRGEIENLEPELCAEIDWFSLDQLPSPLTPSTASILKSLN